MQNDLRVKPVLSDTLAVILPNMEQTWLLRACLLLGEPARQAWAAWCDCVGDPIAYLKNEDNGIKGLLPLLFVSLQQNQVSVDETFQTCLKTAYLRDELRNKKYRSICGNVLAVFRRENIQAIVLKGAALADTVYENPVLQHSHNIDVLIKENDLNRAASLLLPLGFAKANRKWGTEWRDVNIEHESGLPLVLHRSLFPIPFHNTTASEIRARSQIQLIADVPTRVLSPEDNLLHVCGHAPYPRNQELLRWVCDSWFIVNRYPDLDWEILLESAQRSHLTLLLSVTLSYMAENLDTPVPATVLERLYAAARRDTIGRETALFELRMARRVGFRNLIRRSKSWRARALIMKWIFFPSPSYLLWVQQVRNTWLVPFYYIYRPVRYTARQIWSFFKVRIRSKVRQKEPLAAPLRDQG